MLWDELVQIPSWAQVPYFSCFTVLFAVLTVCCLFALAWYFSRLVVHTNTVAVVYRLGKEHLWFEGAHWLLPGLDRYYILPLYPLKAERKLERLENCEGFSVDIEVALEFVIASDDDSIEKAKVYFRERNEEQIVDVVEELLKGEFSIELMKSSMERLAFHEASVRAEVSSRAGQELLSMGCMLLSLRILSVTDAEGILRGLKRKPEF